MSPSEAGADLNAHRSLIFDERLERFRADESQIAHVMIQAVEKHAEHGSDGFLPLAHDTKLHAFQRADCIAALGKAATQPDMMELAPVIYPGFPRLVDRMVSDRKDLLSFAGDVLEHNGDITIVTDHRQIIGLAVVHCAVMAALYESGEIQPGDVDTEIIVSEMLKYVQLLGMPAVYILQDFFSQARFVVPAINRKNKEQLPAGYAETANVASVESRHQASHKPRVTAVAMSATSDAYSSSRTFGKNKRQKGYYMAPPTNGAIEEYALGKYVLPIGIDMSREGAVYIGRLHRGTKVRTAANMYAIMEELAEGISEASGVKSIFIKDMDKFRSIKEAIEKH